MHGRGCGKNEAEDVQRCAEGFVVVRMSHGDDVFVQVLFACAPGEPMMSLTAKLRRPWASWNSTYTDA